MSNNLRFEVQLMRQFNGKNSKSGRSPFPNQSVNKIYTPLNTDRARILEEIRDKLYFEPCPTITHQQRGDQRRYCNYHLHTGHSTEDCRHLKILIDKNVQNGELVHYVAG